MGWLKEWRRKRKEEQERCRKKADEMVLRCHDMKMALFADLIENKNLFAKESLKLADNLTVTFRIEVKLWEELHWNIAGWDYYECTVSRGGTIRRTKTNSIPTGSLFFLTLEYAFPLFGAGTVVDFFTLGQRFHTLESRSSELVNDFETPARIN